MADALAARFADGPTLAAAIDSIRTEPLVRLRAFTPYPVPAVQRALGGPRPMLLTRVAGIVAASGVALAYLLQWWISAVDLPLDVGARPNDAAPAFVPIMFETAVLFTSLTTFGLLLGWCGLPRLWRPEFEVPGFEGDPEAFWLVVHLQPGADVEAVRAALDRAHAGAVTRFEGEEVR